METLLGECMDDRKSPLPALHASPILLGIPPYRSLQVSMYIQHGCKTGFVKEGGLL